LWYFFIPTIDGMNLLITASRSPERIKARRKSIEVSVYSCESGSAVFGIERAEKDGMRGRVEMLLPEEVGLNGAKDDEKKPAEGQAHVHVAKDRVLFKNPPVKETLREDLL